MTTDINPQASLAYEQALAKFEKNRPRLDTEPDGDYRYIDGFIGNYKKLNPPVSLQNSKLNTEILTQLPSGRFTPLDPAASIIAKSLAESHNDINALVYFREVRQRFRDAEDKEVARRIEVARTQIRSLDAAIKKLSE